MNTQAVRDALISKDWYFVEYPNDHFKVERVSFWATRERWYDEEKGVKGCGFNSYLQYVSDKINRRAGF